MIEPFSFSLSMNESFCCSTSSPSIGFISFPNFGHSNRCVVVSHSSFNLQFPDDIPCGASLFIQFLLFKLKYNWFLILVSCVSLVIQFIESLRFKNINIINKTDQFNWHSFYPHLLQPLKNKHGPLFLNLLLEHSLPLASITCQEGFPSTLTIPFFLSGKLDGVSSKKLKIELPYDPAVPPLGTYPEKIIIQKHSCTPMFIAALFTVTRTWKQPKCPSMKKWIKKSGTSTQWNITQPSKGAKSCHL